MKKKNVFVFITILLLAASIIGITVRFQDKNSQEIVTENEKQNSNDISNEKENQEYIDINNEDIVEVEKQDEIIEIEEDKKTGSSEEIPEKQEITSSSNKTQIEVKDDSKKDNVSSDTESTKKEKTLISTETKTEDKITYKYGVKITTTKTYLVSIYSDGTTEKQETNSKTVYDKSTFNATTNELKAEATTIANKNKSIYNEVLGYVNGYRNELGKKPLVLDDTLSVAATIRALEMAYSSAVLDISHTRPNGTSCGTIFDETGISWMAWGENIAAGYRNAKAVSEGWRNSKGHYENMTKDYFGKIGIGMVELNGDKYWVQLFTD